jgi:hypothetical protein
MRYPLEKLFGCCFFYYGMEQKKQKIKERKRKGDKDFGKCSLQNKV